MYANTEPINNSLTKNYKSLHLVTTTTTQNACPGAAADYAVSQGYESRSGKYYKAFKTNADKKNFYDALEVCHKDGATLAEYRTADDYAAIEHYRGKSWQCFNISICLMSQKAVQVSCSYM